MNKNRRRQRHSLSSQQPRPSCSPSPDEEEEPLPSQQGPPPRSFLRAARSPLRYLQRWVFRRGRRGRRGRRQQHVDLTAQDIDFLFATGRLESEEVIATAIAEALTFRSSLRLVHNKIDEDRVRTLAKVLKTNDTLHILDLDMNTIGAEGAIAIAEALKINSSLQELRLVNNYIHLSGAKALAEALKTNSTLQTLYIFGNNISESLSQHIKREMSAKRWEKRPRLLGHFNR